MRHKKGDIWIPDAERFPTVYKMNDIKAIIFSHYYAYNLSFPTLLYFTNYDRLDELSTLITNIGFG